MSERNPTETGGMAPGAGELGVVRDVDVRREVASWSVTDIGGETRFAVVLKRADQERLCSGGKGHKRYKAMARSRAASWVEVRRAAIEAARALARLAWALRKMQFQADRPDQDCWVFSLCREVLPQVDARFSTPVVDHERREVP